MKINEVEIKYSENHEIWDLVNEENLEFRLTRDSLGYPYQIELYDTLRNTTIQSKKIDKETFITKFQNADNYTEVL